jgi:hypothetical protein
MHRPAHVRFPRFAAPLAFAALVPAASGQAVLQSWFDPAAWISTYRIAALGDVDGDGRADVAIMRLLFNGSTFDFVVDLCSSVTGAQLIRIDRGYDAGIYAIGSAGDVDGDGRDDLLVGTGSTTEVLSSATGALLASQGGHANMKLGIEVLGLGDVDGDGVPDFAATVAKFGIGGFGDSYVEICSGADGSVLLTLSTPGGGGFLGAALARAPDLDGDGIDELVVGNPLSAPAFAGFVKVFSPTSGNVLAQYDAPAGYYGFGSDVAVCRDFTGDGIADFVVLGGTVQSTLPGREIAWMISGADGSIVATLPSPAKKTWTEVTSALDANGDGWGDFALGSTQDLGKHSVESVWLYDGRTQLPLYTFEQFQQGNGPFVAGLPDVNGDGRDDLLMGVDASNLGAVLHSGNDFFLDASPIVAVAGETFTKTLRTGITGNLGLIALVGVNGIPLFLPILGPTTFDATGTIGYQVTIPAGLAGLTLDYLGFAIDARGKVAASAVERVVFE